MIHRMLLAALAWPAPAAPAQTPVAIVHARIIDGRGGAPIEDGTVVVRGDRIVAVGPAGTVAVPAGARRIEARGQTMIPGLADMHTHLTGGWDGETADFLGFRRTVGSLLHAGVTSVLDPGNVTSFVKQLRDEINAGRLAGPRIYYAGPVIDGPKPIWPDISAAISSADQLPHFLTQLRQADVTFAKAYHGLSTDMVRALVDSAARDSLRVIADVGLRNGSLEVAKTGIAAFAHAGSRPMADEAIKYMAEHQVASITTLAVYESFTRRRFADLRFLEQPLLAAILPPTYVTQIRQFAVQPLSAEDSLRVQRWTGALASARDNVRKMHAAGVMLVAGTDAPYPGDYYGEGLHRELELLVEAGLSPLEVITIATRNAARLVRAEAEWGTLEPGKIADLVIVSGDPSRTISDTRRVVTVMQRGRIVNREMLRFDPRRETDFAPAVLRPH
jgi:imidazolonepropionase-like amidohydrolase